MLPGPRKVSGTSWNCLSKVVWALFLSVCLAFSSCFPAKVVKSIEKKDIAAREFDAARDLYLQSQWKQAAAAFGRYIQRYPHSPLLDNALFWLGSIHIQIQDYAGALAHLQRIQREFPDSDVLPEAYKAIGFCQFHLKAYDQAIAAYQEALDVWGGRENREEIYAYQKQAALLLQEIEEKEKRLTQADRSRLGCLLPLSGKNAAIGRKFLQGIQLAFLNDGYLEGGQPLKLIVKDSGGEPQQAIAAVEELAFEERVIAILGPALPEIQSEVLPLAQRYHLPLFSPSLPVPPVSPGERSYAFSNALNNQDEGETISHYAVRSLGLKTFAVLHPTTPYGIALKEVFLKGAQRVGGRVIAIEAYDPEDHNLSSQVQRLKEAWNRIGFQALFLPDFFPRLGIILPQLAFYGLRIPLLGGHGWHSPHLEEMGNGYAEGAVFATGFFANSSNPVVKKFVHDFRQTFGEEPTSLAAQAYDAAKILFGVLRKGSTTRDQLRDELLQIRNFPGVSGLTSINPSGQATKKLFLLTISDGQTLQLPDNVR